MSVVFNKLITKFLLLKEKLDYYQKELECSNNSQIVKELLQEKVMELEKEINKMQDTEYYTKEEYDNNVKFHTEYIERPQEINRNEW